MNRVPSLAFRVAVAAIFLFFGMSRMKAQEPASTPPKQEAPKQPAPPKQAPVPASDAIPERSAAELDGVPPAPSVSSAG